MKKSIGIIFLLCFTSFLLQGQEKDELLQLLKQELKYNMEELQKKELPPYYMNLRVEDMYQSAITSNFGAVLSSNETHTRILVPQIRLGSYELDNFKYSSQGLINFNGTPVSPMYLPLNDSYSDAIRQAIWQETIKRYDFAANVYEQTKSRAATTVEDEDKSPCFSKAAIETYYEAPVSIEKQKIDMAAWAERLNEISAVFKKCPKILQGSASINFQIQRNYFVNTDGTEIVQNRVAARIMLSASTMADDGMELPLSKDYFAYDWKELPSNETIIADAEDIIQRLLALREAPVSDPYTGPAILSGAASGVFFHEIFGHRLEGHRLKAGGQTFKKMVGEQILPSGFNVFCDPTLRRYADTDLNGSYLYDDEGVKATKVDNVVGGVLKGFLMNRVPIEDFPQSNGHGRATEVADPVSRQSNLVIETTLPHSEEELRAMLIEEAKAQGKEYGYFFKTVTSGFTYTGEGGSLNSFNVTPLEVLRVYVDGRPDQLVRGVDLIGTPLSMFSNIQAGGSTPSVFTGSCGAESGWVPVTACSPEIYVSKIETQRREQSREIPPILPAPEVSDSKEGNQDDVIFKAMNDELRRSMDQLVLPNESKPFYISNSTARSRHIYISGVLGGIIQSTITPWSMQGGMQLAIGDYMSNSEIEPGQSATFQLPAEADYDAIRRSYWIGTDQMYRYAINSFVQKKSYLKTNPLSPELAAIPDMVKLPAVTKLIQRDQEFIANKESLEELVSKVSAVFADYEDIYDSNVVLDGIDMDIYRQTSEDVKLKIPQSYLRLTVTASIRSKDSASIPKGESLSLIVENPNELPSVDILIEKARNLAESLLEGKDAPFVDEYYSGPVMFEGDGVATIFYQELIKPGKLIAFKSPLGQPFQTMDDKLGRKILDSRITIKDIPSLKTFNGVTLMGSREIDVEGVTPKGELTLVENGVFKNMINGRFPTLKSSESTGNSVFPMAANLKPTVAPSVVHVKINQGIRLNKMKSALLKNAKKKKLDYAYILRFTDGGQYMSLFKVNVKTGKESMVRVTKMNYPTLEDLEKRLKEVSSEESVRNFIYNGCAASIIYPSAMIVDDIEIFKATPKAEKAPALINPLLRN